MAPWTNDCPAGGTAGAGRTTSRSACRQPASERVGVEAPFGHDLHVAAVRPQRGERLRDGVLQRGVLLGGRDPGRDLPERRPGELEQPEFLVISYPRTRPWCRRRRRGRGRAGSPRRCHAGTSAPRSPSCRARAGLALRGQEVGHGGAGLRGHGQPAQRAEPGDVVRVALADHDRLAGVHVVDEVDDRAPGRLVEQLGQDRVAVAGLQRRDDAGERGVDPLRLGPEPGRDRVAEVDVRPGRLLPVDVELQRRRGDVGAEPERARLAEGAGEGASAALLAADPGPGLACAGAATRAAADGEQSGCPDRQARQRSTGDADCSGVIDRPPGKAGSGECQILLADRKMARESCQGKGAKCAYPITARRAVHRPAWPTPGLSLLARPPALPRTHGHPTDHPRRRTGRRRLRHDGVARAERQRPGRPGHARARRAGRSPARLPRQPARPRAAVGPHRRARAAAARPRRRARERGAEPGLLHAAGQRGGRRRVRAGAGADAAAAGRGADRPARARASTAASWSTRRRSTRGSSCWPSSGCRWSRSSATWAGPTTRGT